MMNTIIAQAYQIFSYPKPIEITNVCTECCMPPKDAGLLLTTDLKEIPLALIHEYNDGAQALVFDRHEFMYFLPRYLELISQFEFTSNIDVSLSLKNLKFENEEYWKNTDEVKLLKDFFLFFFNKCLKTEKYPENCQLIEILNMIYVAGIQIEPLLQIWIDNLQTNAIIHLEELIVNNFNNRGNMYKSGFVSKEFSLIIEDWIKTNKTPIILAIENHIMNSTLENEKLHKLGYLYDTILYL